MSGWEVPTPKERCMLLLKLVLLLLGLLLVGLAAWIRTMNARAAGWPQARGVIVRSEHERAVDSDNDAVHIEFEYTVGGRTHRAARVSYAGVPAQRVDKEALVARYPVGREVTVHYDPATPGRATLECTPSRNWIGLGLMGLGLLALGLFLPR